MRDPMIEPDLEAPLRVGACGAAGAAARRHIEPLDSSLGHRDPIGVEAPWRRCGRRRAAAVSVNRTSGSLPIGLHLERIGRRVRQLSLRRPQTRAGPAATPGIRNDPPGPLVVRRRVRIHRRPLAPQDLRVALTRIRLGHDDIDVGDAVSVVIDDPAGDHPGARHDHVAEIRRLIDPDARLHVLVRVARLRQDQLEFPLLHAFRRRGHAHATVFRRSSGPTERLLDHFDRHQRQAGSIGHPQRHLEPKLAGDGRGGRVVLRRQRSPDALPGLGSGRPGVCVGPG